MSPRVYVACLAAYNNGKLHGAWIDAAQDVDAIQEEVKAMLAKSPEPRAEEWAIHDHEGFEGYKVSEWESFETLSELATAIEEHGSIVADLMGHLGLKEVSEAVEYLQDNYQGTFRTLEDWAENYMEDTGLLQEVPESMRPYIDVEKWARDAELGGDVFTIEGGEGIHVFNNR